MCAMHVAVLHSLTHSHYRTTNRTVMRTRRQHVILEHAATQKHVRRAGCPASTEAAAAIERMQSSPACFVLYDRHVEKNGGSTMSVLMQRLEEHRECLYWGYHITPNSWGKAMQALRGLNSSLHQPLPRLCIDAHQVPSVHTCLNILLLDAQVNAALASSCPGFTLPCQALPLVPYLVNDSATCIRAAR